MKKIIFIAIGVLILGSAFAVTKNNKKTQETAAAPAAQESPAHSTPAAAPTETQRFDDWAVVCEEYQNEKKEKGQLCYARQSLSDKETKQVLAEYRVGYFGDDKALKMIQILPADVSIASGTSLIADKDTFAPGKYTVCQNQFCIASAELSEEIVSKLISAKQTFLAFINSQGQQVNSLVSAKGLDMAVKALKK